MLDALGKTPPVLTSNAPGFHHQFGAVEGQPPANESKVPFFSKLRDRIASLSTRAKVALGVGATLGIGAIVTEALAVAGLIAVAVITGPVGWVLIGVGALLLVVAGIGLVVSACRSNKAAEAAKNNAPGMIAQAEAPAWPPSNEEFGTKLESAIRELKPDTKLHETVKALVAGKVTEGTQTPANVGDLKDCTGNKIICVEVYGFTMNNTDEVYNFLAQLTRMPNAIFAVKLVEIQDGKIRLNVFSCSTREEYHNIVPMYFRDAQCVIANAGGPANGGQLTLPENVKEECPEGTPFIASYPPGAGRTHQKTEIFKNASDPAPQHTLDYPLAVPKTASLETV